MNVSSVTITNVNGNVVAVGCGKNVVIPTQVTWRTSAAKETTVTIYRTSGSSARFTMQ
jgi:hypothetical protein